MHTVLVALSGIEKVKVSVIEYRWTCPKDGKRLAMQTERALLKLIERHQQKDEREDRLRSWGRDVKAHIGKVNSE